MIHHRVVFLGVVLLALAGCTQISIAEEEQLRSTTTAVAETAVSQPAETGTPVAAVPTELPTTAPTAAAPTNTPQPTVPPLPPTPTPDADLQGFSLCDQVAGDPEGGRFSAQVTTITTTVEAKFERLEIDLNVPDSSVPPYALSRCLSAADTAALSGQPQGTGYTLLVDLQGWLHDDLFAASMVSPTLTISGTTAISAASFQTMPAGEAGANLAISLREPLPYKISLEQNPTRLVVDVARTSTLTNTSDLLTQTNGQLAFDGSVFSIQDGDVWSYSAGKSTNLTDSDEAETALAVSDAAQLVAFCRAEPGASDDDALAASTLWVMNFDGSDPQELAAPGRTCGDLSFSPDGSKLAMTSDQGSAMPPRLGIYTVDVDSGEATLATAAADEWSRFGPQWLDNDRLVYAAQAEDSRNTLFMLSQGVEEDIGAALTVGGTYTTLGTPLVAPDGSAIALEATRPDGGASLVVLDGNGVQTDEVATGYWARPVAWNENGTLFYLVTDCQSSVAQQYSLMMRPAQGQPQQIAYGLTLGGFGQFAAQGDVLTYVAYSQVAAGSRGPQASGTGDSSLWALNAALGTRGKLADAQGPISALAR